MNTVPEDCARFVLTRSKDLANFVLTFDRVTYFVAMILMKQPIHKFSNIVDLKCYQNCFSEFPTNSAR